MGSSRSDGDTSLVVNQFRTNPNVEIIDLLDLDISFYDYKHKNANDDFIPLMKRIVHNFELIIFATPVYWYTMSGHTKVFLDRFTDLLKCEKEVGRKLRGKKMALLSVSNDNDRLDSFPEPFKFSASYLGMAYLGNLHCVVNNREIENLNSLTSFMNSIID